MTLHAPDETRSFLIGCVVGQRKHSKHWRSHSRPSSAAQKGPMEAQSCYNKMQPSIERTRLGLNNFNSRGAILSGAPGESGIPSAMDLLMSLGYSLRLPEPPQKLKINRVAVHCLAGSLPCDPSLV